MPAQAVSAADTAAMRAAGDQEWPRARAMAQDALVKTYVDWRYFTTRESGADFDEIRTFIERHPEWPQQKTLRQRAEEALVNGGADASTLVAWFEKNPPITGYGKIRFAEALGSQDARFTDLIREGWAEGNFAPNTETGIMQSHRALLRREDHAARAHRLLYDERTDAAERLLSMVSAEDRAVLEARIALIRNSKQANAKVEAVPASKKSDVGLLYDRIAWHTKRKNTGTAQELLAQAPAVVPFPEKWWKLREPLARAAIRAENGKLAARLLKHHGQEEGANKVEALWLSGWVKLDFLKQPDEAYKDFYALFNTAKFPVSKARAAYWAGKAAEQKGHKDIAIGWFREASTYPTTFYGQAGLERLSPNTPLRLANAETVSRSESIEYSKQGLPRMVVLLSEAGLKDQAYAFTLHLVDTAENAKQAALAATLGERIGRVEDGVKAAKRALQANNTLVLDSGYPRLKVNKSSPLPAPFVHAIVRQESEFDSGAESSAGALGLMQLLPSTAKEVARKNGLGFSKNRLYEGDYNVTLGSLYLSSLVDRFDGSYVLAIAAYNAGPGRVREWLAEFGDPGRSPDQVIRWLERIPFEETRNYVQRVMENMQVYRHILTDGKAPDLQLFQDLVR